MAPQASPGDWVVSGACRLVAVPRAPLQPERWAAQPARLARMDRLCALALTATDGALVDAALAPRAGEPAWNGDRTAVVLGTAFGCHATNEDYYRGLLAEGVAGASPRLFAYTLPSSPVGEISIHYGIRGPATTVAPGLTAGLEAIGAGLRELASGRADRALIAAAEVATPLLERLLATSVPLVDAGAALILERTADAAARGATPRGRILASASSFLAGARATAVAEAARRALEAAELGPGAVSRLFAAPEDAAAIRPLGVEAASVHEEPGALGASPLLAAAHFFLADRGLALVCAGDPEGAGAAALVAVD